VTPIRRAISIALTSLITVTTVAVTAATPAFAAGLPASAPLGLTVARDAAAPNDLLVKWKAPTTSGSSALDRYDVSVIADGVAKVSVVPAAQTSLKVTGSTFATTYKIKVASRNLEGLGSETGYTTISPAVPGAPSSIVGGRDQVTPTSVTVSWGAPARAGYTPVTAYTVSLKEVASGITKTVTAVGTKASFTGLPVARTYLVTVRAVNAQGAGTAGNLYIGNSAPSAPGKLVAVRDPQDPSQVRVSWAPPVYAGIGPITGYQIGQATTVAAGFTWLPAVSPTTFTASIPLDVKKGSFISVRAVNQTVLSFRATEMLVSAAGVATPVIPATPALPVVIGSTGSSITANLTGSLAKTYATVDMTLEPQFGTTFTDATTAPASTTQMVFGTVPDGIYLVRIHGLDAKGVATELKNGLVTIGTFGQLSAADWQVVMGSASISGQTVDITKAGEVRVLDTRALVSEDATLTTTATLHAGSGYGIWVRATHETDNTDSGYAVQLDPGWGNKVIVRHWSHNVECSSPLTFTAFPAGFDPYKPHEVKVGVHGETLVATFDGIQLINIPSLTKAVAASNCPSFPVLHGTRVGFRSWGNSSSTFVGTALNN